MSPQMTFLIWCKVMLAAFVFVWLFSSSSPSLSSPWNMPGELEWEHCTFFSPFTFSHQTSKVSNLREARFRLGWPCRLFALLPKLNHFCRAAEDGIRLKTFWIKGMQNSRHCCMSANSLIKVWSTYKTSYKDNTRCLEAPRSGLNSGFVPCSSSGSAYYRILIKQLKHLHFGNHFCLFCIFPHSSFWCSKQEFQANLVLIWGCIPWDGNYLIIATANKIYTQLQKQNKTLQIFWQLVLLMIIICAVNVGMKRKL